VPGLIDTHAHLDEIEDLETTVASARAEGVEAIIAVGQDLKSNLKVLELADYYRGFVFAAIGLHPWALGNLSAGQLEENINFISVNIGRAVALGEVGLDYDKRVIKGASKEAQKSALTTLLNIAASHNKPVSLHSRYAWKDCLQIVKGLALKKVVFHWYTGFSSTLSELLEAGYFISATPAAEYHDEHRRAIREAPVEQLMLETDCPVYYGRDVRYRSSPADVARSLKAASAIKSVDEEQLAQKTTSNARRFFGIQSQL
jgi:TatD DNase family protein